MSSSKDRHGNYEAETADSELVQLALEDNGHAFALLVDRYFPMVVALGISRLGDREAAEELAQEVFMRVFLKLDKLRDRSLFATWITRITRNVAEDWARSQQKSSRAIATLCLEEIPGEIEDHRSADPCEHAIGRQRSDLLNQAVFRLPQHLREIVLLHYVEDLEKVEIARRLGVHASTVGRRLDHALGMLRCSFQDKTTLALACKPSKQSYERTRTIGVALASLSLAGRVKAAAALAPLASAKTAALSGSSAGSAASFLETLTMMAGKLKILLSRTAEVQISAKSALVGLAAPAAVFLACFYLYSVAQGGGSSQDHLAATEESAPLACGLLAMPIEPGNQNRQLAQDDGADRQQP